MISPRVINNPLTTVMLHASGGSPARTCLKVLNTHAKWNVDEWAVSYLGKATGRREESVRKVEKHKRVPDEITGWID